MGDGDQSPEKRKHAVNGKMLSENHSNNIVLAGSARTTEKKKKILHIRWHLVAEFSPISRQLAGEYMHQTKIHKDDIFYNKKSTKIRFLLLSPDLDLPDSISQ